MHDAKESEDSGVAPLQKTDLGGRANECDDLPD